MTRVLTGAVWLLLLASVGAAQDVALVTRAPRFLMPGPSGGAELVEVDASRIAALRRRVALALENVRLEEALNAVAREAEIRLVYVRSILPLDSLVRFRSDSITVAAALTELLLGLRVDVLVSGSGQIALVRSTTQRIVPGNVVGRVVDSATDAPLAGAAVYLEGTRWRTATAEDGGFRLTEVLPGSYTLVVRRIGYAASRQAVTVADGETVEVAIALTLRVTMLDEVVVTATGPQERVRVGNAIARIDAESLTVSAPIRGLTDLITARAAGVQVLAASGVTGQAPRIRVRGLNSFSVTNDPLIVIDGVRVENSPGSNAFASFSG
ncbi:MAG TPA: carboxypeptidase-like regulatory domain-containing protein, partial [Gemmatimonadales bacterium]